MTIEKAHVGRFGRWVIGEQQAKEEKKIVAESTNVYGEATRGKRSLAATAADLERIRSLKTAEAVLDTATVAAPGQPTEVDPAAMLAAAAGITIEQASLLIQAAQGALVIAPTVPPPLQLPIEATAGVRPTDVGQVLEAKGLELAEGDQNANGIPDRQETAGGYLRVADMPEILAAQPELIDRVLELELGRADRGRKTAYQAIHAAELQREGGPRAEVLAAIEGRI